MDKTTDGRRSFKREPHGHNVIGMKILNIIYSGLVAISFLSGKVERKSIRLEAAVNLKAFLRILY